MVVFFFQIGKPVAMITSVIFPEMEVSMYAIRGLLYFFDSLQPSHSVGRVYHNGTWTNINSSVNFQPKDQQTPIPKYAIPYYMHNHKYEPLF